MSGRCSAISVVVDVDQWSEGSCVDWFLGSLPLSFSLRFLNIVSKSRKIHPQAGHDFATSPQASIRRRDLFSASFRWMWSECRIMITYIESAEKSPGHLDLGVSASRLDDVQGVLEASCWDRDTYICSWLFLRSPNARKSSATLVIFFAAIKGIDWANFFSSSILLFSGRWRKIKCWLLKQSAFSDEATRIDISTCKSIPAFLPKSYFPRPPRHSGAPAVTVFASSLLDCSVLHGSILASPCR